MMKTKKICPKTDVVCDMQRYIQYLDSTIYPDEYRSFYAAIHYLANDPRCEKQPPNIEYDPLRGVRNMIWDLRNWAVPIEAISNVLSCSKRSVRRLMSSKMSSTKIRRPRIDHLKRLHDQVTSGEVIELELDHFHRAMFLSWALDAEEHDRMVVRGVGSDDRNLRRVTQEAEQHYRIPIEFVKVGADMVIRITTYANKT